MEKYFDRGIRRVQTQRVEINHNAVEGPNAGDLEIHVWPLNCLDDGLGGLHARSRYWRTSEVLPYWLLPWPFTSWNQMLGMTASGAKKIFFNFSKNKNKNKKNMELRWTETNYFEFFLTNQSVVRLRNNFAINIKFSESCKHVMNKKWFSNIFHQVRETWRLKWWISSHQTNDE